MHVVLSLEPGGTERLVIDIARRLGPEVQSVVCCLDQAGAWASELVGAGVPVVTLSRRPGFQPRLGYEIAREAEARGIDVLHCHHYSPFVYGQIAALAAGRKLRVVFTEHGRSSDAGPSLKRRLVNPLLGRLPQAIYAVSADLRRHMIAEGLPGGRISVIHNGIDPGAPPTPDGRFAARRLLGIGEQALVIGTAGRLDPVKDLSTLVESFAPIAGRQPSSRLVIIGDGPERVHLTERAAALGISGAVLFTGYRNDVRQLLPAFDVYANTSIHEGVSLTILEAMAASVPVVATRVGGTPEVIVNGETGVLTDVRSARSTASALEKLIWASWQRRRMGELARVRVERHFSVDAMTDAYLNAYLQQTRN